MTYDDAMNKVWIYPIRKGYKFACCDCGLVHKMDFRYRKRTISFKVERDNRATAAIRRKKQLKN